MRASIGGRTAATAATANVAGCALWNPSTTRGLYVTAISWAKTVATIDNVAVARITARGTATASVTSTIVSDLERKVAPPTGAILDLTYSAQPTLDSATVYLMRYNLPAAIASGFIFPFETKDIQGIFVPPAAGLAVVTPPAVILQPADVTYFWQE